MDAVQMEKHQAMKRYGKTQVLSSLVDYSSRAAMLVLLLSSPIWLSSLKSFFLVSLPSIASAVFAPKCLFIVSNVIVVFLVGESKLARSAKEPDMYEEYIASSRSLQGVVVANGEENKEEMVSVAMEQRPLDDEESIENEVEAVVEEIKEEEEEEEEEESIENELESVVEEMQEEEEEEEEEERGLPAEELNRRIEDFIAKVNMQRRLEARMLICCS